MQIKTDENGNIIQTATVGDIGGEEIDLSMYKLGENNILIPDTEKIQARENTIRSEEIKTRLDEIDTLSIRPLRAVLTNTATEFDTAKLVELETEAQTLRTELGGLTV
jgi:hypothetical protein